MTSTYWPLRLMLVLFAGTALTATALGSDPARVKALFIQAYNLAKAGQEKEAIAVYERALALSKTVHGEAHQTTIDITNNLANAYLNSDEYAKAEPLFLKVLAHREATLGKDHLDIATVLSSMGNNSLGLSKFASAEGYVKRSLAIREAKLGKDDPTTAWTRALLATVYRYLGEYAKAEAIYLRALATPEAQLGKDNLDRIGTMKDLGRLYALMGHYAKAEQMLRAALDRREAKLGRDHPDVANELNALGNLYFDTAEYAKAEPLFLRMIAIEERRGKDHVGLAMPLNNLANLYLSMGLYAKAEPLYMRSVAISEARLGKNHNQTAEGYNNLAELHRQTHQYARAEPFNLRALAIFEATLGKDHPDTARSLNNLANLYCDMDQQVKAEPIYQRALAIREAKLGKDHPDTAQTLGNLADCYTEMRRYPQSVSLFQRAIAIQEVKLGRNHPDLAGSFDNLAEPYLRTGEWGKALEAFDRSRRIVRAYSSSTLPILSETEQGQFLKSRDEERYHHVLSVALHRRNHPAECALSAGWVLNGKAVAGQVRAERILLARESRDTRAGPVAVELAATRQTLAALALHPPEGGNDSTRLMQLADLTAKEQELSRRLTQLTGRSSRAAWAELADVRKALPPGSALVEVVLFDRKKLDAKGNGDSLGERYAAWIIPPAGDIQVLDLGEAAPIDAAVKAARTELEAAAKTIAAKGEPAAEKRLRGPMEALAKLVLHPLLPHIAGAKTWVVSPDSNLWLVPWAALPLPDGKYAVESHTIEYVVTGRDLLAKKNDTVKPTAPLLLADPDFDRGLTATREPDSELQRGLSRDFKLGKVRRLPGTAVEAEAILPHLATFTSAKPSVFTEGQATTAAFKAAKNPRVVVLSTHGFFLEEDKDRNAGHVAENALLRCGLLLAGCNNAARAKPGQDTGVLTGLEIVGTDLRGTEMVVLSACETGLGDIRNGEGVAGLRQAFQLAGAESVVATLWQVPDRDSALLMASFFDKLAGKQARDAALADAQRDMIAKRRDRFGAAHPYYWAAYTLTGQAK